MMTLTGFETLCEVLNGELLVLERGPVLMVKPAELLEDLGVTGVVLDHTLVSFPGTDVLNPILSAEH